MYSEELLQWMRGGHHEEEGRRHSLLQDTYASSRPLTSSLSSLSIYAEYVGHMVTAVVIMVPIPTGRVGIKQTKL